MFATIPKSIPPVSYGDIVLVGTGRTSGTKMNVGQQGRRRGSKDIPRQDTQFGNGHQDGLSFDVRLHLISPGQIRGSFDSNVFMRNGLWCL